MFHIARESADKLLNVMAEKITELSAEDARKFFLDAKCYSTIELPKYFDFQPLLDRLSQKIGAEKLDNTDKTKEIKSLQDINYAFYQNKDGNLAWRKFQLINPILYVYLLNVITDESNWQELKNCFEAFNCQKIECCSIPYKTTNEADSIVNWWKTIELRSLELSLNYNWIATTDLTDCYGSLYTHTISWAILMDIEKGKKQRRGYFHNDIDNIIQAMNYGQTNGIPQGSVLMDFIAELVLGFSDYLLSQKLKEESIEDYKILRYRDDYRIFTKTKEDAVKILRYLSEVSAVLNFKLNVQKTTVSQEIIVNSIKPDKLYWIAEKQQDTSLQKHLLLIHNLAKEHSNSGSIKRALTEFIDRIKPLEMAKTENIKILVAILADIAVKNSNIYAQVVVAIGKLLSYEKQTETKQQIYDDVIQKFSTIPNNSILSIWLQRLAIKSDLVFESGKDALCRIVASKTKKGRSLWECNWAEVAYISIIRDTQIISDHILENLSEVPTDDEVKLFINKY